MKETSKLKIVDYIKAHDVKYPDNVGVSATTLENLFNRRSINTLVKWEVLEVVSKSRLRTDDMEMVYWSEYKLVNGLMTNL